MAVLGRSQLSRSIPSPAPRIAWKSPSLAVPGGSPAGVGAPPTLVMVVLPKTNRSGKATFVLPDAALSQAEGPFPEGAFVSTITGNCVILWLPEMVNSWG